jgi:hypothetical protein
MRTTGGLPAPLLELTIVFRDPATGFPLTTGNSLHTSLTRRSQKEMVDEVLGNIYKGLQGRHPMRMHIGNAVAVVAVALLMGGCAAPAGPQGMVVPQAATAGKQHAASVSVTVTGGTETGALDSSNIANADLRTAIETSITQSRLFKEVLKQRSGDYELAVTVIQLSKPMFGGTFTVDFEAGWSLVKLADKSPVWRQAIKTSGTATMSDSVVGVTRLRMAVEAAARANIQQGLGAIAGLSL